MKNSNLTLPFVIVLCFFTSCGGSRLTKPYINEFFFKLSDEKDLFIVQQRAATINFKWLRCVLTRLHLFRKTDIPVNNEEPVSDGTVSRWMNAFGSMVEYIGQDRYIQVYPHFEKAEKYEPLDKFIDIGDEDRRGYYSGTTDSQETTISQQETNHQTHVVLIIAIIISGCSVLVAVFSVISRSVLWRKKEGVTTRNSSDHQEKNLVWAQYQADLNKCHEDVYSAEVGLLINNVYISRHSVGKQRE